MTAEIAQTDAPLPSAIVTIDPAAYVTAIYAPFRDKLAEAKAEADKAEFDITTTAGMDIAKKHRAVFRDEFRVAIEAARKERKAPILEIGRLLDGKAKEITAEVEPYEKRFDDAIKGEERRKETEKQAKLAAEKARVDGIKARIEAIMLDGVSAARKSAAEIAAAADQIAQMDVSPEKFGEFAGEAELKRDETVKFLREKHAEAVEHEAEQARLAEERAELERQRVAEAARLAAEREALAKERAEAAERDRIAAAARAEEERKAREAREAEETRLKAEREAHEAELRRQREAEEARLRAEREAEESRLAAHRAELQRQQDEINAARAEQERKVREAREAVEAEARAKREAEEAAARAEAQRIADEKAAAEAERIRRAHAEFLRTGPEKEEIIRVLSDHFGVFESTVEDWLSRHSWAQLEQAA